jgi:hypothetical protein
MNAPRRIAALKREMGYRQLELERVEEMRTAGEPTILAFPKFVTRYLRDISTEIIDRQIEIIDRQSEISDLEKYSDWPRFVKIFRFSRCVRRRLLYRLGRYFS